MASAATALPPTPVRRRDLQREQTRLDLALTAFELANAHGLANVRVPEIARAVGVSPRTFNNYFPSKEAAIVWPATLRATRLANNLVDRPPEEALPDALLAAFADLYGRQDVDGLPPGWLRKFRALVASEPALHGEYLKTAVLLEDALADAIADRTGMDPGQLEPRVLAAVAVGAERAAVLYWSRQAEPATSLVDAVRTAVALAVRGMGSTS